MDQARNEGFQKETMFASGGHAEMGQTVPNRGSAYRLTGPNDEQGTLLPDAQEPLLELVR